MHSTSNVSCSLETHFPYQGCQGTQILEEWEYFLNLEDTPIISNTPSTPFKLYEPLYDPLCNELDLAFPIENGPENRIERSLEHSCVSLNEVIENSYHSTTYYDKVEYLKLKRERQERLHQIISERSTRLARTPNKFLDNLKKKAPLLCRRLLRKFIIHRLPAEYTGFSIFREPKELIEALATHKSWPDSEGSASTRVFTYKCLSELFALGNGKFLTLYKELINHLFFSVYNYKLEGFLGLKQLKESEHGAFYLYLYETIPQISTRKVSKDKKTTINYLFY